MINAPIAAELEPFFSLRRGTPHHGHAPRPTSYEIVVDGVDLRQLRSVTGDRDRNFELSPELVAAPVYGLYVGSEAVPSKPLHFAGEVIVDDVRVVRRPVQIAAGTTFRLGKDASLIFLNRVIAAGTARSPIRFQRSNTDRTAWGTIALDGIGTSGSRLQHCEFTGGRGHKSERGLFTGVLSIHSARDVQINHCKFFDHSALEDVVHVVYSTVSFDHLLIDGALSDGLDCDISRVTMRTSRFINCVGDGLDLMDSETAVIGCEFASDGDKGISVGERTRVVVVDCEFDRCLIGMEIKDDSIAAVLHCNFTGCGIGVHAREKNWRYNAGGEASIYRSAFDGDGKLASALGRSRILLWDCRVPSSLIDATRAALVKIVDSDAATGVSGNSAPFPVELSALPGVLSDAWTRAHRPQRGR